jgi:hypothetical protein
MANTFKNKSAVIAATATTIYTAPAGTQSVIHSLFLSNVDTSANINVTLELYDTSLTTAYKILYNVPIPAGSTLVLDKPINLEATDQLRATSSVASKIEAVVSVLEIS